MSTEKISQSSYRLTAITLQLIVIYKLDINNVREVRLLNNVLLCNSYLTIPHGQLLHLSHERTVLLEYTNSTSITVN